MKTTLTILTFLFATFFQVFSATYYVRSTDGLDTNDGLSSTSAFQTLTKVFSLTLADGDVINISGTFDYYVSKTLTKSITIQGTDKSTSIIRGFAGAKKRCFGIGDGTYVPSVVIENVTFQDFDYFDDATSTTGGALNVAAGSALTCRNVNFLNNQAYIGGAISIVSGTAVFEDCYFYNNKTKRRTGATNSDGGVINISIASTSSADVSLTINRCLFENNSTENLGSVLRFSSATAGSTTLLIQNSTFTGNTVKLPATSTTSGCLYLDISSANASTKIINNTIAYNTSEVNNTAARSGISIAGADDKIMLLNNILYSNTNAASTNISISTSKKMKESRNNITNQAYDFTLNTMTDMSFSNVISVTETDMGLAASLANNGGATKTLAISGTSVAINGGYSTGAPAVDQRNITRIGTPDVGAFENTSTTTGPNILLHIINYSQSAGKTIFSNIENFNNVKISDCTGKLINTIQLSGNSYTLQSKPGFYIVSFEGTKGVETIKLLSK